MLFLDDDTMARMGAVLGQHFTEGELNELGDLIAAGAEACDYAAEDMDYREDFERKHDGSEEDDYREAKESYSGTSGQLAKLVAAIRKGEEAGRED
jgi:hypothetical protein